MMRLTYCTSLIILFVITAPSICSANSTYIQLGGWSHHFDRSKKMNEEHNIAGIELELGEVEAAVFGFTASTFKNSRGNTSKYFAGVAKVCKRYTKTMRSCGGITGGFLDGYKAENEGGFFPAIIPHASFEYRRAGIDLTCLPKLYSRRSFCAIQGKIKIQ
ncbi:MAG: hypothetical protein COB51_07995 [Moraxellaceae bacterium]|nr:MAG: hypothetical protein COB51_07995 [Moraxellaceae bacterium]